MLVSSTRSDWLYALRRRAEHAGMTPTGWFGLAVGMMVALVVTLLLLWDDQPGMVALGGGMLALLPALGVGTVAQQLTQGLAHSVRQRQSMQLEQESVGIGHRRSFLRQVEREWLRCRRLGDDGALLLLVCDDFAALTQRCGLRGSDGLWLGMAARVAATLRQSDTLARFDDTRLAVFLSHTDPAGARDAAERIRQLVAATTLSWQGQRLRLTVSVGLASCHPSQHSVEALIQAALTALGQARQAGGNCVCSPSLGSSISRPVELEVSPPPQRR